VGAGGEYAVNAIGGTANAVVVSHTHVTESPSFANQVVGGVRISNGGSNTTSVGLDQTPGELNIGTAFPIVVPAPSNAVSGTNMNLPPYYALAYIMRVA
jgi:hypothetical protein